MVLLMSMLHTQDHKGDKGCHARVSYLLGRIPKPTTADINYYMASKTYTWPYSSPQVSSIDQSKTKQRSNSPAAALPPPHDERPPWELGPRPAGAAW